jgi:hypothetical protein
MARLREDMASLREDMYKWLECPPDMKDRQHELQKIHHEGTGRWLSRDGRFVKWKVTPSSLWIKGICKSILFCFNSMPNNWPQLVPERVY